MEVAVDDLQTHPSGAVVLSHLTCPQLPPSPMEEPALVPVEEQT